MTMILLVLLLRMKMINFHNKSVSYELFSLPTNQNQHYYIFIIIYHLIHGEWLQTKVSLSHFVFAGHPGRGGAVHEVPRPKPSYRRQGLAGGSWGQDTVLAGTFWGVLNVSHHSSAAQLGLDILTVGPNGPSWRSDDFLCLMGGGATDLLDVYIWDMSNNMKSSCFNVIFLDPKSLSRKLCWYCLIQP